MSSDAVVFWFLKALDRVEACQRRLARARTRAAERRAERALARAVRAYAELEAAMTGL